MSTNYITIEEVTGEPSQKVRQNLKFKTGNFVWRVKFNLPLRPNTVNNNTCYVTHLTGKLLNTLIQYNSANKYIEIEPLEPYARNESYVLHITNAVTSTTGKKIKDNISIQFKVN